ncbi:thermonuclease family protein [Kaustia mangrovi]|uniref:Thermonuclease family protein n=1 Tax=Kaustia mangrovi TaxID=2593653 RepID=A0A7S8C4C8_9HYPH|nr:thermonuclease family protein [Kaustia mangrovi]QPC43178.1 thermonuclease family protein [Kaustia mangrovi]
MTDRRRGAGIRLAGHGAIALLAALAFCQAGRPARAADAECALSAQGEAEIAAVVDARTVRLADGRVLRLAGLLGPDQGAASPPKTGEPREALAGLLRGGRVLVFPNGSQADRRGRIGAHLFVRRDGRLVWVQAALAEAGLARVMPLATGACIRPLLALEARARAAGKGLWADTANRVRPAEPPGPLYPLAGSVQIVEGTVATVAPTRARTYLNFGEDWREDFTVAIPAGARGAFEGSAADPARLTGRRIRVRGWIELRNGPMIVATRPEQIELLDGPDDEADRR